MTATSLRRSKFSVRSGSSTSCFQAALRLVLSPFATSVLVSTSMLQSQRRIRFGMTCLLRFWIALLLRSMKIWLLLAPLWTPPVSIHPSSFDTQKSSYAKCGDRLMAHIDALIYDSLRLVQTGKTFTSIAKAFGRSLYSFALTKCELVGPVNRDLQEGVSYESTNNSQRENSSESHHKKKGDEADAIREFGKQAWREALATRKQDTEEKKIRFLEEKESHRMQYMHQRLERDGRSTALQDYAFVNDHLRSLYAKQERESNQRIHDDIEDEITTLKAKKQRLADAL